MDYRDKYTNRILNSLFTYTPESISIIDKRFKILYIFLYEGFKNNFSKKYNVIIKTKKYVFPNDIMFQQILYLII